MLTLKAEVTILRPRREGCARSKRDGAVAQLGERLVRNEEVRGSIPLSSTIPKCTALRLLTNFLDPSGSDEPERTPAASRRG